MTKAKVLITLAAVAVAAAHILFPSLRIDAVTGFLVLLAVLPWLAPIIKSVELPGGFRVELQEIKAAADRITGRGSATGPERAPGGGVPVAERSADEVAQLREVGNQDPNLAIVGLRIAIEKRLRNAAEREGIDSQHRSATWLLRELSARGVLPGDFTGGLLDLMVIANQAAHGAEVEDAAAAYALDAAPWVLAALDDHLAMRRATT